MTLWSPTHPDIWPHPSSYRASCNCSNSGELKTLVLWWASMWPMTLLQDVPFIQMAAVSQDHHGCPSVQTSGRILTAAKKGWCGEDRALLWSPVRGSSWSCPTLELLSQEAASPFQEVFDVMCLPERKKLPIAGLTPRWNPPLGKRGEFCMKSTTCTKTPVSHFKNLTQVIFHHLATDAKEPRSG